jgi:hypothetical protein
MDAEVNEADDDTEEKLISHYDTFVLSSLDASAAASSVPWGSITGWATAAARDLINFWHLRGCVGCAVVLQKRSCASTILISTTRRMVSNNGCPYRKRKAADLGARIG